MKRRPDVVNRKSANSPASRARCLKPALHGPRWTDRFGFLRSREETYPPLRGQIDASRYDPASIDRRWSPVARGMACRDRAASAAVLGRYVRHPHAATAPGPSLVTFARVVGQFEIRRD